MAPEVTRRRVDESVGRLREQHLPAVTGRGDAGSFVHVEAHIPLVGELGLPAVQPHTDADRSVVEGSLRVGGGCDGVRRPREGDEEGITLRVDLDPAVSAERIPHDPAMLVERRPVLVAELVQELRRALHVGEEQRDDAGWEIARLHLSGSIARRR